MPLTRQKTTSCVVRPGEPVGYCEVGPGLFAVAEVEQEQAGGDAFDEGPLPCAGSERSPSGSISRKLVLPSAGCGFTKTLLA